MRMQRGARQGSPERDPESSQAIVDWLFSDGRRIETCGEFVRQLGRHLNDSRFSVDRLMVSLLTLNPQVVGIAETWHRDSDATTQVKASHGVRETERYIGSPLQAIYESHVLVRKRLDDLPVDAHLAYTELAEDGYTDYLALPITFGKQTQPEAAVIVTTRQPGGYSDTEIETFRRLVNFIAPILEIHSLRHLSRSLMNTYVGKRTSEKVLAGMVKRGDADIINAALWYSDLRDFTRLTESLKPAQVLKMLNDYFEFVSAAVTARGGEVLRFIGDAMLIVFPIDADQCARTACKAALDAALDAHDSLATLNHLRRRHGEAEIEFGVGLNLGEVIYGNVGAPDRLDFTVMGPAVNRCARLESLTKELHRNILFSGEFARHIDTPSISMGEHAMKGVESAQTVFALARSD